MSEMRRIIFVHHESSVGGGSYCLLNVVRAIDRSLWIPIVMIRSHGPLEEELKALEVEVIVFPNMMDIPYNRPITLRNVIKYWKVILSFKEFKKILYGKRVDVVYLNNMMLAPYLRAAKQAGCKTVLHVREHWPLDEHKKQLDWIRKIVYNSCDVLIAINNYSASIFPNIKSVIVYDWIDMSNRYRMFSMDDLFGEDMSKNKVLLFTGGFQRIKGVDYIVKTFIDNIKGDNYRLLILGVDLSKPITGWKHKVKSYLTRFGYNYFDLEMRNLIKSDSRIRCIPGVYELVDIVKQSFCFVSYFRMPHANLAMVENIILGNPCIAADNEESREYTDNGKYAMLVKANAPKEFAKQLIVFLEDNSKWECAAKKGSADLAKIFSKEINSNLLNKTINALL